MSNTTHNEHHDKYIKVASIKALCKEKLSTSNGWSPEVLEELQTLLLLAGCKRQEYQSFNARIDRTVIRYTYSLWVILELEGDRVYTYT